MGNILNCLMGREEEEEPVRVPTAAAHTVALSKDNIVEALSYNLHGDIMLNILSRLPVKSLVRFRCVSKVWKRLVISPTFIKSHHARCSEIKLLIQTASTFYICSSDTINQLSFPFSPPYRRDDMYIAGSSNGLICIKYRYINSTQPPILWNPATRQYRFLPHPPILPLFLPGPRGRIFTSFTYLSGTDSFKLVTIAYDGFRTFCIDVFTLNDNHWQRRMIQPGFPLECLYENFAHVTVNESFNWLGKMDNLPGSIIVAFDMNEEYFYYFKTPQESYNFNSKKLAVTSDSHLAMFEYTTIIPFTGAHVIIWRFKLDQHSMNKQAYGNWILHSVIKIPSSINAEVKPPQDSGWWSWFVQALSPAFIRQPHGFWLNDTEEEIIFSDNICNIFLYKPRSKTFYRLPSFLQTSLPLDVDYIHHIVSHVDNSLSLLN